MRLIVLGLSVSSSWGNGHATTWRALLRGMAARGHEVIFLERDVPWYAQNRDLPDPGFCDLRLYRGLDELRSEHRAAVAEADAVIVGSFVPDGIEVARWVHQTARGVTAFYDIDTPVTLAALARGKCGYLEPALVPGFDLYLSFTGGPTLRRLEEAFGARRAEALYCSVDGEAYRPRDVPVRWDLGYLGTFAADRREKLERLLLEAARHCPERSFTAAGPQYPDTTAWPANVAHREHVPPAEHPAFYAAQRFTLNLTRRDMVAVGWSPSVRLFEAAACGTPVISDRWPGLGELLADGTEILTAETTGDVLRHLADVPAAAARRIGAAARDRVMALHTGAARAAQLEHLLEPGRRPAAAPRPAHERQPLAASPRRDGPVASATSARLDGKRSAGRRGSGRGSTGRLPAQGNVPSRSRSTTA